MSQKSVHNGRDQYALMTLRCEPAELISFSVHSPL